jgi:ATP adenylyltransferase/5',5'''-P-1,P-4-tetraphosphate phosphorylase II
MSIQRLPEIFKSVNSFSSAYSRHLLKLLNRKTFKKNIAGNLGELILLSAQSTFDKELYKKTYPVLNEIYSKLSRDLKNIPQNKRNEDYEIASKISKLGWKNIPKVSFKKLSLWHIQYNELRTLKPRGAAKQKIISVYKKFDKRSFNFNKPSVKNERFWKGKLNGMDVSLLHNKFPFVEKHTLIVPEQEKNHPQFLKKRFHYHVFDLMQQASGFATGYNSIGAFASVNNLHFQMFIKNEPLAVENEVWKHNGGKKIYPAVCYVFESKQASWKFVKALHTQNIPYNILYTKEKTYIFPMNFQKRHKRTIFPLGFAWIELAGSFINVTKKNYEQLTEKQIFKEFRLNKFTKKLTLK